MIKFFQWAISAHRPELTLFLIVLSACNTHQKIQPVPIGSETFFQLESPASYQGELNIIQRIQVEYKQRQRNVVVQLEINHSVLRMVALGQMGITLFSLSWDGQNLKITKPPEVKLPFRPEYFVADMQLALWPEFPTNPALSFHNEPLKRVVSFGDKSIVTIDYPQGRKGMSEIIIHHIQRDYTLKILRLDE